MDAYATPYEPGANRSAGRVIAGVAGWILAALAVTFVVLGGALLGMHSTKRDSQGFYGTGKAKLHTPTHALVADKLDANGPGWLFEKSRLGTIRVQATGTSAKPVFVGVAKTSQIDAYLRGVAQDELTDFDVDPFTVDYKRRPGTAVPAAPGSQAFWAARTSGSGRQTLTWPVEKGNWGVVIMNADGSAGVQAGVSVGAKAGFLVWVAGGLLALGALFAAWAATIYFGLRRHRPRAGAIGAGTAQPVTQ
jgi:hypothetical protein